MCKGNMSWSNKFFKYIYPLNKSCILRLSKVDHLILRNHFFSLFISQLDCSPLLLIRVWLIVNQEGCLQCIGAWVVNLQILLQDQGRTYAGACKDKATMKDMCPVLKEVTHMAWLANVHGFIMKGFFLSSEENSPAAKVRKNERTLNRNGKIYTGFWRNFFFFNVMSRVRDSDYSS